MDSCHHISYCAGTWLLSIFLIDLQESANERKTNEQVSESLISAAITMISRLSRFLLLLLLLLQRSVVFFVEDEQIRRNAIVRISR